MIKPTLYDSVEVLLDLPEQEIRAGMQGAIVHQYDEQTFEVEFTNEAGETLALVPLSSEAFIVIWQAEFERPVSVIDQVAQIVARLPQEPQNQLLDFARFLSSRKDRA